MKKLFSLLMLVVMTMLVFGVVAYAEGDVVTYYEVSTKNQFNEALTKAMAVTDGTEITIKLMNDITNSESSSATTSKINLSGDGEKVVIDLGGNTFTTNRRTYIKGDVTIKNGNFNFTNNRGSYYAIYMCGTSSARAKLTMENVNLTATSGTTENGISMQSDDYCGDLVLTNTNITAKDLTIMSNADGNNITINSGNFISSADDGNVVKFQRAASVVVNGGTFKNTTAVPSSYLAFNGGQKGPNTVQYYGGTLPVDISTAERDTLPEGYYCLKTGADEYTVEDSIGAAKIVGYVDAGNVAGNYYDGTHFKTLALAVSDAEENQEITLLANNTEAVEIGKLVTIAKNGFTATGLTAGEGYVINETDAAYVVAVAPEEPEEPEAITVSAKMGNVYDDGNGTKTARFFADIDTLEVAEAGFEVTTTVDGEPRVWTIALSEVYEQVIANGVTYNATNYILTGAIGEVPNDFTGTFTVKTFVTDFEGNTEYSVDSVSVEVE